MHRWRRDKPPAEADSLETLASLAGFERESLPHRKQLAPTLFDMDEGPDAFEAAHEESIAALLEEREASLESGAKQE